MINRKTPKGHLMKQFRHYFWYGWTPAKVCASHQTIEDNANDLKQETPTKMPGFFVKFFLQLHATNLVVLCKLAVEFNC